MVTIWVRGSGTLRGGGTGGDGDKWWNSLYTLNIEFPELVDGWTMACDRRIPSF